MKQAISSADPFPGGGGGGRSPGDRVPSQPVSCPSQHGGTPAREGTGMCPSVPARGAPLLPQCSGWCPSPNPTWPGGAQGVRNQSPWGRSAGGSPTLRGGLHSRGAAWPPRLQTAAPCVHPVTSSPHLCFGSPRWIVWGHLPALGPQTAPSSAHCEGLEGLGTAGGCTGVAHAGLALAGIPGTSTALER